MEGLAGFVPAISKMAHRICHLNQPSCRWLAGFVAPAGLQFLKRRSRQSLQVETPGRKSARLHNDERSDSFAVYCLSSSSLYKSKLLTGRSVKRRHFVQNVLYTKRPAHSCGACLLELCSGDSYRIQTCNLLIRSQMLYSVELRSRSNITQRVSLRISSL